MRPKPLIRPRPPEPQPVPSLPPIIEDRIARYEGLTERLAYEAWVEDDQRIQACGYRQVGPMRWADDGERPTIAVSYEYRPPSVVSRQLSASGDVRGVLKSDARWMFHAGYVVAEQRFVRTVPFELTEYGVVTVTYTYDPVATGGAVTPIPPLPGEDWPDWGSPPA